MNPKETVRGVDWIRLLQYRTPVRALVGRAMAQAVSRRPLTAKARVRSRVSPCGIYGGRSGTGTGFFPRVLRFSPVSFIPPVLHYMEKLKKNTHHLHHTVAQ
jgi:hypothetical protein